MFVTTSPTVTGSRNSVPQEKADLVTKQELKQVKERVIAQCKPSAGLNLEGMFYDFPAYLSRSGILAVRRVRKTGTEDNMIEATCEPASASVSMTEAVAEIEGMWMTKLQYRYFEAHAVSITDKKAVLDFVTTVHPDGSYVTGCIIIDEQKFGMSAECT